MSTVDSRTYSCNTKASYAADLLLDTAVLEEEDGRHLLNESSFKAKSGMSCMGWYVWLVDMECGLYLLR